MYVRLQIPYRIGSPEYQMYKDWQRLNDEVGITEAEAGRRAIAEDLKRRRGGVTQRAEDPALIAQKDAEIAALRARIDEILRSRGASEAPKAQVQAPGMTDEQAQKALENVRTSANKFIKRAGV